MTITMYELLGLIKDSKAPKKIIYENKEYEYNFGDYFNTRGENLIIVLENSMALYHLLQETVEILSEENDEWEDIEEINNSADNTLFVMECYTGIPEKAQDWNFNILENKINQLIKNQKSLKERLDNDR